MKNINLLKVLLLFTLSTYAFFSIRVSKSISKNDEKLITLLDVKNECDSKENFSQEILCIKKIQNAQFSLVKGTDCRGKFVEAGSIGFLKAGTGCCWDRSRLIEKTLDYYGYQVRHIHLNHTEKKGFFNIFFPNTPSHAVSEVLTSKGWLGVDSNEKFVLIKNNIPYTYAEGIKIGLADQLSEVDFYKKPMTYIIGLYTRNGTYYKPYLPFFPEVNYIDLILNLNKVQISKFEEKNSI